MGFDDKFYGISLPVTVLFLFPILFYELLGVVGSVPLSFQFLSTLYHNITCYDFEQTGRDIAEYYRFGWSTTISSGITLMCIFVFLILAITGRIRDMNLFLGRGGTKNSIYKIAFWLLCLGVLGDFLFRRVSYSSGGGCAWSSFSKARVEAGLLVYGVLLQGAYLSVVIISSNIIVFFRNRSEKHGEGKR